MDVFLILQLTECHERKNSEAQQVFIHYLEQKTNISFVQNIHSSHANLVPFTYLELNLSQGEYRL